MLHKGENGMLFHPLKVSHAFSSLIVLFILIFYPGVLFADADRIFRENNKAVVVIVTYDSQGNAIAQGSGFIIRADGAIATNYHVISNAKDIKIKAGSKVLRVEGLLYIYI
jgi:S1-C subfamily serine protease